MSRERSQVRLRQYLSRILGCLVLSLLVLIGVFTLWPTGAWEPESAVFDDRADEYIALEEIQPTQQAQSEPPPPPAPLPPVEVPDEVELEELDLDFTADLFPEDDPADDLLDREGTAEETTASGAPDEAARQLRLVEPDYSREARRDGVRARVVVEVLVNEQGNVDEAVILERTLLDEDNQPIDRVGRLGYGLEESALDAARRTTFFPARARGEPVESRTTITIRFGV